VLGSGRGRRNRELGKAVDKITSKRRVRDILPVTITGDTPATFRLGRYIDHAARNSLEEQIFGKRILITDGHAWTTPEVIVAFRSQSDAEFGSAS